MRLVLIWRSGADTSGLGGGRWDLSAHEGGLQGSHFALLAVLSAHAHARLLRQQWPLSSAYSSLARPPSSTPVLQPPAPVARSLARPLMPSLSAASSPPATPLAAGAASPHSSRSQHGESWPANPHVEPAASGRAAGRAVRRPSALLVSRLHAPLPAVHALAPA